MLDSRAQKAKMNFITVLLYQGVSILCGLITPQLLIRSYGSEIYGATMSISQFLSYITLLQGGIGGVARAALYKPIAEKNMDDINGIMGETRKFFRIVAAVFLIYTVIIASVYKYIADFSALSWISTFLLVISISISTLAQYYFGIVNDVFLRANQKHYIVNILDVITVIINTGMTVLLVKLGFGINLVKLVSSSIFMLKPIFMMLCVSRKYGITYEKKNKKTYLTQKWTGLGQHIAFFLHSNADVVILTLFSELKSVSIYAVYHMVISHIKNLCTSFVTDVEAVFGSMLARKETEKLIKTFDNYDTLVSLVSSILFSATMILIVSFVKLYTQNINDANYIEPLFAVLLVMSEYLYCLRQPYHNLIIAAGHFKETKLAAYGEAAINIILSLILVGKYRMTGVAIGTVCAVTFRFIFYVLYLEKNILARSKIAFIKRACINMCVLLLNWFISQGILKLLEIDNYFHWTIAGCIVFVLVSVITISVNALFYREIVGEICKKVLVKLKRI